MRVLCNDTKCVHWKACEHQKIIYGHGGESLSTYIGECARKQDDGQEVIGILPKDIVNYDVKLHIPECQCFGVMGVTGHMDFSKLPQGGQIPDPIAGDSAFHV
jgi:hypothetical protein